MMISEEIRYLYSLESRGSHPGLERIKKALEKIGDPQKGIKAVQVTGTNGKGSFCAFLSSALSEKYKVGVFSSPFLEMINESVSIDGSDITDEELSYYIGKNRDVIEDYSLTQFEALTLICLDYFYGKSVDIAVIEVGMGGRGDATNVFSENLLTVITDVSIDHTNYLGDSISSIAYEKSGLIRQGCPCFFGGEDKRALDVIAGEANVKGSALYTRRSYPEVCLSSPDRNMFICDNTMFTVFTGGLFQVANAALALDCLEILAGNGYFLTIAQIVSGFKKVRRKARFEVFSYDPYVIFDGGHNRGCIDAFMKSYRAYFGTGTADIIMGVMADKEYGYMVSCLSGIASRVAAVTPPNPRALSAERLAGMFAEKGIPAKPYESFSDAIGSFAGSRKPLFCLGSLYSYAGFRKAYSEIGKNNASKTE